MNNVVSALNLRLTFIYLILY